MLDIPIYTDSLIVPKQFIEDFCTTIGRSKRTLPLLYGIFLETTRQLYSSENNLLLGLKTVWNADPVKTRIWIDTEYIWEDKTPDVRPAIYISIKGLKKSAYTSTDSHVGSNTEEGLKYYSSLNVGQVSFVHIGQSKGETINLTSNTADYMEGLSDIIKDDFCFKSFQVTDVTPLQVFKESKDNLRGEVIAEFKYDDTWSIKTESPKLKKIIYTARQVVSNLL